MGYSLNAFIGPVATLKSQMGQLPASKLIELRQGLAMLPLSYEVRETLDQSGTFKSFWFMPTSLSEQAKELSRLGSLGYVEVDFFGGTGEQKAILWKDGKMAWGPTLSEHKSGKRDGGAVNQLARLLGTQKLKFHDEFEAIGLERFRSDEDWLASV